MKRIKPNQTSFARKLRKDQTDAEKVLWFKIKNRQLKNIKFRRQFVIDQYIVDFACTELKLVIEIDGGQHNEEKSKLRDEERTRYIKDKGYAVIRFWNNEILENIDGVLDKILSTLTPTLSLSGRGTD